MFLIKAADARDAEAIASVRHRAWLTAYRGIICDGYLDAMTPKESSEIIAKAFDSGKENFFVVREEGGEIVGFCVAGAERTGRYGFTGELYAIYLLEEFRRFGLGARLVKSAAESLLSRGISDMLVWVLEKNPSVAFYKKLGAKKIGSVVVKIGEEEFVELAYGFNDLKALKEIKD